jgi:hypothetical protein
MRITHRVFFGLFASIAIAGICRADLETDMERESVRLRPIMPEAERLTYAGFPDQAEAKILAAYPEKIRTPAQNLLLANILFRSNHALSFKLHKAAAEARPDDPAAAYEWGIELHRAGEWDKGGHAVQEQWRRELCSDGGDAVK